MNLLYNKVINIVLTASTAILLALTSCSDETKVAKVELSPSNLLMKIGETTQIEMIVTPLSATSYNPTAWHSSDSNIATVDEKGNVTALYAGTCTITGQSGHKEATCRVTVTTPTYILDMPKAVIFNSGIEENTTSNYLTLRLHEASLSIDSTGNISGNGQFLNLSLYAPISTQQLPAGTYTTNTDMKSDFSIEPGNEAYIDGETYATGSFLGKYINGKLSVTYIREGTIEVTNDSSYNIKCTFEGKKNEHIEATFNGNPTYYDISSKTDIQPMYYTKCLLRQVEIPAETDANHISILFTTASDTIVAMTARIPLTAPTLPPGYYITSDECRPFTLVDSKQAYTCIISRSDTTNIVAATLNVTQTQNGIIEYHATLTDTKNKQYTIEPGYGNAHNINAIRHCKETK